MMLAAARRLQLPRERGREAGGSGTRVNTAAESPPAVPWFPFLYSTRTQAIDAYQVEDYRLSASMNVLNASPRSQPQLARCRLGLSPA